MKRAALRQLLRDAGTELDEEKINEILDDINKINELLEILEKSEGQ